MAQSVMLKKGEFTKEGYVGFSWTTLFFGSLVPLIRGDWKWFGIILITQLLTYGLASIVFAFIYNAKYTRGLLENQGYEPAGEEAAALLKMYNIYSA